MDDVKTIRELMEDASRKQDKLVSNLTNTLQVKRNQLSEMEARCTETTTKLNFALREKDRLIQSYYENMFIEP